MIYWVTETATSSARLYFEQFANQPSIPRGERVGVPTGAAIFPGEIQRPTREAASETYNIQHWTEFPQGGHFAALQRPREFVEDVRAFFRPLR